MHMIAHVISSKTNLVVHRTPCTTKVAYGNEKVKQRASYLSVLVLHNFWFHLQSSLLVIYDQTEK